MVPGPHYVDLTGFALDVTAGQKLRVAVRYLGGSGYPYHLRVHDGADVYDGGMAIVNGTAMPGRDLAFRTVVIPAPE